MGRAALVLAAVLAALALSGAASTGAATDAVMPLPQPRLGCPPAAATRSASSLSVEEAIEEARRVVARGRVFVQGRWHKRTRTNQTVIAATEMARFRPTRSTDKLLYDRARHRCGASAVTGAWAVVFHDGVNVLCCETPTVYVVRRRSVVWVY